jgi:superoxide reductase
MEVKFYICKHCGNIITYVNDKRASVMCCGQAMEELVANTTDAAQEKHVPVVTVTGSAVTVDVGSVAHPMTEEHYISWIYLQTQEGIQCKYLTPGMLPHVKFVLADGDQVVAAYAYCNLHGLWKA